MQGRQADGEAIRGRTRRAGPRTGFVDFTFSASKPLSVAIALAPTAEERAALIGIHQGAVAAAMKYVEREIGHVRRGKSGRGGTEAAEVAWVSFDHFTARPIEGAEPDRSPNPHPRHRLHKRRTDGVGSRGQPQPVPAEGVHQRGRGDLPGLSRRWTCAGTAFGRSWAGGRGRRSQPHGCMPGRSSPLAPTAAWVVPPQHARSTGVVPVRANRHSG
jgi:hypothetical protein